MSEPEDWKTPLIAKLESFLCQTCDYLATHVIKSIKFEERK